MAMSAALSNEEVQAAWVNLAEEVRTGVLLTLRNGRPFGSHVPYVFGEHWTRAYIHVSRLALHTEHLLRDPRVGLFVSEPDRPGKNPLALRRMNLQGEAALLNAGAPDYAEVKERYLARFPQSAMMFGFADFCALGTAATGRALDPGIRAGLPCRGDYSSHLDSSEAEYEERLATECLFACFGLAGPMGPDFPQSVTEDFEELFPRVIMEFFTKQEWRQGWARVGGQCESRASWRDSFGSR